MPELGPVQVPFKHTFASVVEPAPNLVTYPREGGTKYLDVAGKIDVNLLDGVVTLPDDTTDTITRLSTLMIEEKNQVARSLILESSKNSLVDIGDTGYWFTLPAGTAVPLHKLAITNFTVTVPAKTEFRFAYSTREYAIPNFLDLKSQEYYTEQFREKIASLGTDGTSVTISPPVKQTMVYVNGADVQIEWNGDIDSDSFLIPDGGSISYPLLTESIAVQTVSGTADVYIRGLR